MAFNIDGLTEQVTGSVYPEAPINVKAPSAPGTGTTGGSTGTGVILGLNPNHTSTPEIFVFNAIVIFLWIMGIVTVLTFIYSGVKYITAGGDSEKAESAKKIIVGSIIGMLIILASFVVFRFGVNVLNSPSSSQTQAGVEQLMNQK